VLEIAPRNKRQHNQNQTAGFPRVNVTFRLQLQSSYKNTAPALTI
jgi:hypothetical protein